MATFVTNPLDNWRVRADCIDGVVAWHNGTGSWSLLIENDNGVIENFGDFSDEDDAVAMAACEAARDALIVTLGGTVPAY